MPRKTTYGSLRLTFGALVKNMLDSRFKIYHGHMEAFADQKWRVIAGYHFYDLIGHNPGHGSQRGCALPCVYSAVSVMKVLFHSRQLESSRFWIGTVVGFLLAIGLPTIG